MEIIYGISKSQHECVLFCGTFHIQFKIVNKRLKIRKYKHESHKLYLEKLYSPYWCFGLTLYK